MITKSDLEGANLHTEKIAKCGKFISAEINIYMCRNGI